MSDSSTHWLAMIALRAGLGDAMHSGVSDEIPVERAWPWVADFLGITQEQLAKGVGEALRLPTADLANADPSALAFLPKEEADRLRVLPIQASDRELVVATSDPLDFEAEREVAFLSSRRTVFEVAPPDELTAAREKAYEKATANARETIGGDQLDEAYDRVQLDPSFEGTVPYHSESVIKVERLILYEASKQGATEVHVAPRGSVGRVQFELDGQLKTFVRVPLKMMTEVVDRLRTLAGLSHSGTERESGTIPLLIADTKYTLSVHTVPSSAGHLVLELEGEGAPAPAVPKKRDWQPATTTDEGHILIVDDDAGGRMLMRTVLEKNGFEVTEVDDGSTAIPFLQEAEDIDGILLDLMMKSMDGLETLERIRKSIKTAALPVVILTGSEDPEDEKRLMKAGADDYLHKPVDPLQLVVRIRSVLKRAGS